MRLILENKEVARAIYVDDDYDSEKLQQYAEIATSFIKTKTGYDFAKEDEIEPFSAEDCRVLVVDDNLVNRKVARGFLRPYGFMIDEADSASEYRVFLDFLAQLRGYYIIREKKPIFQSVILAGVYDIKNLKNKFVEEYRMNSPWNVAADFDIDLRLREHGIAGMLADYEEDHHTGMNIQEIAGLIYDYTSGYPFLVSRICKLMDEKVYRDENEFDRNKVWTKEGFLTAVRMLLTEENTLFDSLDNKLIDYPDLKQMLLELLLQGNVIEYVPGNLGIRMAAMSVPPVYQTDHQRNRKLLY